MRAGVKPEPSGWPRAAGFPAILLAALALVACRGPKDPIQALLVELEAAAEARDAPAVRARLAADFAGPSGIDAVDAESLVRRYLAGYERIELDLYDVSVEERGETARVSFAVDFRGEARSFGSLQGLLPPEASYRFELDLGRRDGRWLVTAADWRPQPLPGAEAS